MTEYRIKVRGVTDVTYDEKAGIVDLVVTLPTTSEETEFVHLDRGDGEPMLGLELAHGEAIAGWWPDGEDWVSEIHVPNPIGHFADAP